MPNNFQEIFHSNVLLSFNKILIICKRMDTNVSVFNKLHLNPNFSTSFYKVLDSVFFSCKLQKARAITFLQFTVPKKIAFALAVKSALIYRFRKIVPLAL